jgi:hypothetical protein
MHICRSLLLYKWLSGVNPATNDRMILYYCLMTKWIDLGDSMVFSWAGCHNSLAPLLEVWTRRWRLQAPASISAAVAIRASLVVRLWSVNSRRRRSRRRQLLPAGTGGFAGGSPRGVPKRRQGRRASRELRGESPPGLGWPCCPAYVRCTPPGDPKDPRRGAVTLPGWHRGAGHGLNRCRWSWRWRRGGRGESPRRAFEEVSFRTLLSPGPSSPEK